MKTAFIIHGTGSTPSSNWFQSVGENLQDRGYTVIIPAFPIGEDQNLENWKAKFEDYKKYINTETIFIAHSIAPSFVCSILEEIDMQVEACYFVSGFIWDLWLEEFKKPNETFSEKEFNWEKIRNNSKKFYMCHADDDPYVPMKFAQDLADNLRVEIDIIENGKHLNGPAGYTDFPYLLQQIK